MHKLMFGKPDATDIARSTDIDRRDVLLHLCIVGRFVLLVVPKQTYQLPNTQHYNDNTHRTQHITDGTDFLQPFYGFLMICCHISFRFIRLREEVVCLVSTVSVQTACNYDKH